MNNKPSPHVFALVEWLPNTKYKSPLLDEAERLFFTATTPNIDVMFSVVMLFRMKSSFVENTIAIRFLVPERILHKLEIESNLSIFDGRLVANAKIVEFLDKGKVR